MIPAKTRRHRRRLRWRPFVLFTPDHPLAPEHREPMSMRTLLFSYWVDPRRHPDFGWAWLTRFLASLAIGMGTLYLLYFLRTKVTHTHATQDLFVLIVIYTVFVIITAIVGPAAVAGALSADLVSLGGYPTLYAATAVVAAVGSIFVWRIKSVP